MRRFALVLLAACGACGTPRANAPKAPELVVGRGDVAHASAPAKPREPAGSIGGRAFESVGLYAALLENELILGFSSEPDVCDSVVAGIIHPRETRITLEHLTSAEESPPEIGKLTTQSAVWRRIVATCPVYRSGEEDPEIIEAAAGIDTSKGTRPGVEITKLGPDTVEGRLELVFDDGSHLEGRFVAPLCVKEMNYDVVCR